MDSVYTMNRKGRILLASKLGRQGRFNSLIHIRHACKAIGLDQSINQIINYCKLWVSIRLSTPLIKAGPIQPK